MNVSLHNASELPPDVVDAWCEVLREVPALDHPLLHPTWARLAAETNGRVEVAVLRASGKPVGFLPFERTRSDKAVPVATCMSDLQALIARPETKFDLAEVLRACRLSAWHYDHLPAEQAWFAPYHARVEDAPRIDLDQGFDAYWNGRRNAFRSWTSQLERKARKLAREIGPLRFVWHANNARVAAALTAWKRRQLSGATGPNAFALPWFAGLLDRVVQTQSPGFSGALSALYAGETLVAAHLGMHNARLMSSWIPTYNPEFARYSPGALLHVELARAAAERGLRQIELGRGINPLKQSLGSSARKLAIGAVDVHPVRRWCRSRLHQLRNLADAAPFGRTPLHAYRHVRNWLAASRSSRLSNVTTSEEH